MNVIWLRGEGVALGPAREDLVPQYWQWENDPGTVNGYGRQVPESLEVRTEGFGHQVRDCQNQSRFTVYRLQGDEEEPVGLTTLLHDHMVGTAEFLIVMAPGARGQGLGAEATRLTLDYAFHLAHRRMVYLKVLERNVAGIRAYRKAGFKEQGTLPRAGFWFGVPCGETFMSALPEDFPGPSVVVPPGVASA